MITLSDVNGFLLFFGSDIPDRICNKTPIYSPPHLVLTVGTIPYRSCKITRQRTALATLRRFWPGGTTVHFLKPVAIKQFRPEPGGLYSVWVVMQERVYTVLHANYSTLLI